MKLHIGCGNDIKKDWINHDIVKLKGVDVVHDLSQYPWPWSDGTFEEIYIGALVSTFCLLKENK